MSKINNSILTAIIFFSFTMVCFSQPNYNGYEIVIEETYYFDELDYAFYQSYNAFLNGENAKSGARLRRAAYFVQLEAKDAKVHNKKPILKQADRLNSLADSIALGKIHYAYKLRRAFANTHNVLANDYKLRAAAFWAKDKTQATGRALVASAGYLGHAAKWSGKTIGKGAVGVAKGAETAGIESIRAVRWLGGKMIKGVAFVPSKVGEGLSWLGKGINKVGDITEPKKR